MHPRVSIDQICLIGDSPADFIGKCKALGVRNTVLSAPHLLTEGGVKAARAALAGSGISVEAVNGTFATFPNLPDDTGQARERMLRLIEAGASLGAKSVYFLTGGRGHLDWDAAADRFAQLLAPCAEVARDKGMMLMIENASVLYADAHIAHTLADTITLAERADIGVCLELFFCWAEADLKRLFRRVMPRCGLVQVSDYILGDRSLPARAVPGDGAIPLERLIGDILDAGYEGVFDIELLGSRIENEWPLVATKRAAEYLSELLTRLGA